MSVSQSSSFSYVSSVEIHLFASSESNSYSLVLDRLIGKWIDGWKALVDRGWDKSSNDIVGIFMFADVFCRITELMIR
jgi:hypothetical protein